MKKFAVFTFFAFFVLISASAKKDEPKKDTYDYDNLVTSVRGVRSPLISDEYILFTAEKNARNVGIAFDFENFSKIHAFSMRSLCGCSLYSGDYYSLSLFSCVKSGIIHSVVDVCLSLASRLSFHVLHEHVLGLLCSHARDVLDLLVRLLPESLVLLDFLLQRIFLRLKASLGIVNVSEALLVSLCLAGLFLYLS